MKISSISSAYNCNYPLRTVKNRNYSERLIQKTDGNLAFKGGTIKKLGIAALLLPSATIGGSILGVSTLIDEVFKKNNDEPNNGGGSSNNSSSSSGNNYDDYDEMYGGPLGRAFDNY